MRGITFSLFAFCRLCRGPEKLFPNLKIFCNVQKFGNSDRSSGLVVMGINSCSGGRGFDFFKHKNVNALAYLHFEIS